ncbi:MAG TPA: tRNA (N6-threonylcarbamoyladenosine(37)-N6)-methyltransferase TrmO [Byssovorax sp.]|jgi:tRNA-Thr(GGU) m(6)t(6)A37 methyltransferase TsaA
MTRGPTPNATLTVRPIGVVRSPFTEKAAAPRQAVVAADREASIELVPGQGFEDALDDLARWERIWIVFWFDRAEGWRPKVQPPRSAVKRGVFATRAPHRPNPIGMSSVELLSVEGLVVRVRGVDLLDGTPVLDLKPYVAYADAFPGAKSGWLDDDEPAPLARIDDATPSRGARFEVTWSELASAQRAWLEARGVDLVPIAAVLEASPRPHAYKRIRADNDGRFTLAHKDLRARFRVDGRVVTLEAITTGYRPKQLAEDPSLDLHRAFLAAFPLR